MKRPTIRRPASSRWHITLGWPSAIFSCSILFVVATEYADALVKFCGWASPHIGVYGTALLLAVPLACIAYVAYLGRAPRKRHLKHMVPSLFITFLVYAFAVVHMASWGVCDASTPPYVAASALVGAVLSGITFGVYWDVYGAPGKGLFRNMAVLTCIMAVAAFAYNVLQAADGWDPPDMPGARMFLVAIAMVAMAVTVGIFGAECAKNRGQSRKRYWALSMTLIAVGVLVYVAFGPNDGEVGYGDYIQLYVAQTLWSGVTIAMAMFGAYIAANWPTKSTRFWLVPMVALVGFIPFHPAISSEWDCLTSMDICTDPGRIVSLHEQAGLLDEGVPFKLWALATALVIVWHIFMTMPAAMLGAAVAARMRAESAI